MSEPLIYLAKHAIQPGKQDVAREQCRQLVEHLEAHHPTVIHFSCYVSDDGSELTVIQVHPDEDSLALHMQVAGERIARAYEFLERTTDIQIYGSPSDDLVSQIHQMSGGAPVGFHTADCGLTREVALPKA